MTEQERKELFITAYSEYKDKIYRLIYSYIKEKDQVDDIFQEVFLCIWKNLHSFRHESKISTWIYRIAVNTTLLNRRNAIKSNKILCNFDSELLADTTNEDSDTEEEKLKQLQNLRRLISSLDDQDRMIISLFMEDLSYKEIADIAGISVNYAGVKINRIKNIIKKGLNNYEN
jgi:RNA polymerase sigma-70 factor (ECF subfamily)